MISTKATVSHQKRVVAAHDISCVGKCSLTVALPIISAAGIECSVLPTAVLSTHTGGFTGFTYRDLTEDILPILNHWSSLSLGVDAIYTGYLGSFEQIALIEEMFRRMPEALKFIDPVMADNGKLYASFAPEFAGGMAKLCAKADVIVPNITEAVLMLGEEYIAPPYTRAYIEGLLARLATIGPKKIVLTGVDFGDGRLGAAAYEDGEIDYAFSERIEGYYHGTGDVFASAVLSALLRGLSLAQAAKIAVVFTVDAIDRTHRLNNELRYGVRFEESIPLLIALLNGKA